MALPLTFKEQGAVIFARQIFELCRKIYEYSIVLCAVRTSTLISLHDIDNASDNFS